MMFESSMILESNDEILGTIVRTGEFDSFPFYLLEDSSTVHAGATSYFEPVGGVVHDKDI